MIASWMIYIVLVSATVTIAAAVVESALRATRLPTRLLWVVAICFPVVVAIASAQLSDPAQTRSRILPTNELRGGLLGRDQPENSSSRFVPSLGIAVSPGSRLAMFDLPLLTFWIAASLLTLGMFGGAAVRLRRIRSAAEARDIEGVRVSVTRDTGPLVVGVLHPQILIPRWVLELDRSEQQLIVAHEQEHLHGRDPALLAFSAFVVVLTPWNPLLWYMLRRLGRAVELDCDRRVLAERPDMRAYTGLLLSVASRSQSTLLPLAGLAASTSSLEERFRSMTTNPTRNRGYRLFLAATVAVLLLVATAMMPRPIRGTQSGANLVPGQAGARATGRVRVVSGSRFSTYKVYATGGSFSDSGDPPAARVDTLNQFVGALNSAGRVFNIDVTNGDVHFVSQDTSSIHVEAAMFGGSQALWFSATGRHLVLKRGGVGILSEGPPQAVGLASNTFFEFQVDTPAVVREAVKPKYPDPLKASGIGGEVLAQFVVDRTGHVDMTSFKALQSSGPEFTAAVKEVLPRWKIDPAIMKGTKVSQLVQQAFEFSAPKRE